MKKHRAYSYYCRTATEANKPFVVGSYGYAHLRGYSYLPRVMGGSSGSQLRRWSYVGYVDAVYNTLAMTNHVGYLDNQYAIYKQKPATAYLDAFYAVTGYRSKKGYLSAQYNIQGYADVVGYLSAHYALVSSKKATGRLNGYYALQTYHASVGYLSASYDTLCYKSSVGYLNARYNLQNYQLTQGILDSYYALLSDDVFYGWAINLESGAISEFEGFNFVSLSGDMGGNSAGLYRLQGNDDTGTAINASVQTGKLDFGDSHLKRISEAWITHHGGGLSLTVSTESHSNIAYPVASTAQLKPVKTHIGKGAKGRYWQFTLANVNGSQLDVSDIELAVMPLSKRA